MNNQYDSQIELMRRFNISLQERAFAIDEYIESQKGQIAAQQALCEELKRANRSAQNASDAFGGSTVGSLASSAKALKSLNKAMDKEKAASNSGGLLSTLAGVFKKLAVSAASVASLGFSVAIKGIVGMFKIMKVSIGALLDLGKGMIDLVSAVMGVINALYSKLIEMAHELMSGGSNAWAEAIRETKMHFGALNQDAPNAAIRMAKDMSAIPEAGLSVFRVFGTRGELLKEFMTDYVKKMEATFEIFAQEFADSRGALLGIAKGMGYSGEEMNTLAMAAITRGHPLGKELVDTHNAIWKVAKPFGISTKLISRDVAKAEKNVKNFGAATKESLVNAVVQARILGLDFEKLDGLMGTFSSIDSSTEAGIKLFEAFEVEIDPYLLLRAQETGTILDHLRDQFKMRGVDASKFNRANAGLLASVTGLSAETAKQALSLQNGGKALDEIQSRQDDGPNKTKSLSTALKELADSIEFKVLSGSMPKGGFLDMWLEGLYSQMFRNKHFRGLLRDIGKSLKVFYYEGTRFFNAFMEAVPAARGIFGSLRTLFNPELFKVLIGKIYGSFNKLFIGMKDGSYTFTNFMDDIKQAFSDHLEAFNKIDDGQLSKSLYAAALLTSRILGKSFTEISSLFSVGIRFIAATIRGDKTALNLISKSWKDLKRGFKGAFKPVLEAVTTAVDSVGSAANSLIASYDYAMRERNLTGFSVEALQDKTRTYFDKGIGLYNNAKDSASKFFKKLKEEFAFYIYVFVNKVIPAIVKYVNYLQWYSTILGLISLGEIVWRTMISSTGQATLTRLWRRFKGVFRGNTAKVLAAADDLARASGSSAASAISKVRSFSGGRVNLSEKFLKHSLDLFTGGIDKNFKAITENKNFKELLKRTSKGAGKKFIDAFSKMPGLSRNLYTKPEQMLSFMDDVLYGKNTTRLGHHLPAMLEVLDDFAKTPGMSPKQVSIIQRMTRFLGLVNAGVIDDVAIAKHLSGESPISVLDDLDNLAAQTDNLAAQSDGFLKPNLLGRAKDSLKSGAKKLFSVRTGIRAGIALGIAAGLYHVWPKISESITFQRGLPVAIIGLNILQLSDSAIIARTLWKQGLKTGLKTTLKLGVKAGAAAVIGGFLSTGLFLTSVGAEILQIFGVRNGFTEAFSFSGMIKSIEDSGESFYETFLTPEEVTERREKKRKMARALALVNPLSDGIEFLKKETEPLVSSIVENFMAGEFDSFSNFFQKSGDGYKGKIILWSEMNEFQKEIQRLAEEYVPVAKHGKDEQESFIQKLKVIYDSAQQSALEQIKDRIDDLEVKDDLYHLFSPLKQSADRSSTERFSIEAVDYIKGMRDQKDQFTKKVLLSKFAADKLDKISSLFAETIEIQTRIANYSWKDSIFEMLSSSFEILKSVSVEKFILFINETIDWLTVFQKTLNFEELQNKIYNLKRIFEYTGEVFSSDLSENWYSFTDEDSNKIASVFYGVVPDSFLSKARANLSISDDDFIRRNLARNDRTPSENRAALRLLHLRVNLSFSFFKIKDIMLYVREKFSSRLMEVFNLLSDPSLQGKESVLVFSDSLMSIFKSLKTFKFDDPKEISAVEEQIQKSKENQMTFADQQEILYSEYSTISNTERDYFYISLPDEGGGSHFSTLRTSVEKIKSNDNFQILSEKSKKIISLLTDFFTPISDFIALMTKIRDSFENAAINPQSPTLRDEKDKKVSFKDFNVDALQTLNEKMLTLSSQEFNISADPGILFLTSFIDSKLNYIFSDSFKELNNVLKLGNILNSELIKLNVHLNSWVLNDVILRAIPAALSDIQTKSEQIINYLCFIGEDGERSERKKDDFALAVSKSIDHVMGIKCLYFVVAYNACTKKFNDLICVNKEHKEAISINLSDDEIVSIFNGKTVKKNVKESTKIVFKGEDYKDSLDINNQSYNVETYSQADTYSINYEFLFMSEQTVSTVASELFFDTNSIFNDRIKCIKEKLVVNNTTHYMPPKHAFSPGNFLQSMKSLKNLRDKGNTADLRFELFYDHAKNPKPTITGPVFDPGKI